MTDLSRQIAGLSPEKRELLERLLKKDGLELSDTLIVPQKRDKSAFPLSFSQQRLWFLDQLEPGSPLYNIPSALRLSGRLDVQALERSLNEVIRRHETLRTTFAVQDGQPVQVIAAQGALPLPVVDLRSLPSTSREAEALRLATQEAGQPFDLSGGPLIRASLLRVAEEEYIIFLTMHHIISDGWSMGVLVREIIELYESFTIGHHSPLPELSLQYVDFAGWQRKWLSGKRLEEQLQYWQKQLGENPAPILELPTDRPRSARRTSQGAERSFTLSPELSAALNHLSQQAGVTLFMTLLAAFQVLLYRYSGQEDICVGTPIANRTRAEIEGLIGFFVNTLVMRGDLSGGVTFRELLARTRETALGAYAHQDMPFEKLVDTLQPERDLSHPPIFQVMFALQNLPPGLRKLKNLTVAPVNLHSGTAKFDLTLVMAEGDARLSGSLEYNSDLFEARSIERFLGNFQVLLESIVADPGCKISALPILTPAEREQLLLVWNSAPNPAPQGQCIHQLFEAQAERAPQAVAVACAGQELTYRELEERANQLAQHLIRSGVKPDTLVGLSVERSIDMLVGILGILKAGGAYVPLDPNYPRERLDLICHDAQLKIVLTTSALYKDWAGRDGVLEVVDLDRPLSSECTRAGLPQVSPTSLAYVLFTSGSTGKPKGVMIEHRNVLALLYGFEQVAPCETPLVGASVSPFGFDVSVWEFFCVLCFGGTLHLLLPDTYADPQEFADYLIQKHITNAYIPPALLTGVVGRLEESQDPIALKRILVGVEPIKQSTLQRFRDLSPHLRILNGYGPTEATVCATLYPFDSAAEAERRTPIGVSVPGYDTHVVSNELELVPLGVTGELIIGGPGVARGYLNDPEMTRERFVPQPFAEFPGKWVYRTGDPVRRLPDGNIEFIGRVDHQVKVRGFRVELGEIETVLSQHPAVREGIVLARESQASGDAFPTKYLVAYIVPAQPEPPSVPELRKFLQDRLPEYMLPSAFVFLEAIPLTANGKIDRRALPIPSDLRPELENAYVAPRTPSEEILAGLWSEVLGVQQVGVHDNFFDLGGHSLLATRLASRIRETFEVEIPLRAVFEAPTVAAQAEKLADLKVDGTQRPPEHIPLLPRSGDLPLSFAQQRLWFLDQFEPDSPAYNIPSAISIRGQLDEEILKRSLQEIVRRHETLRTTFASKNGKAVQIIAPEAEIYVPVVDLRSLPAVERMERALQIASKEAQQPFDLARGPLLRFKLLRAKDDERLALITLHHIVSDGWSAEILIHELASLYAAFSRGEPSPLAPLAVQYADFAAWQRAWLQGEARDAQLDYWKEALKNSQPVLALPADHPRPAAQTYRGDHYSFRLPTELTGALKKMCRSQGVTPFMFLLAAFETLLHRYSGQEDFNVGTPIANRNRADLEGLIGFFVNTLVLPADFSADPTFSELLQRTRATALGAYDHPDLPFEMLVDALQPSRDTSVSPLFQVMFVYQEEPRQPLDLPGLSLAPFEVPSSVSTFDLSLILASQDEQISAAFEYNTDLFEAATIARLSRHFLTLLEAILDDPFRKVSALPLLCEAERRQLLVEFNDTQADFPRDACLHQLFEQQATRTPGAPALLLPASASSSGLPQRLSFRELNRRANLLAHTLIQEGVSPGSLVAVCLERSFEMVVALLAILKAGAAYLPLDPDYPSERLRFLLDDAQPQALLTFERLVARLPASPARLLRLDADWERVTRGNPSNPALQVTPEQPAYLIYTSGSTGKPKGVLVPHRAVVNHNTFVAALFGLHPGERILQFASLSFDTAVEEIFPALLSGAAIVLRPPGLPDPSSDLQALIDTEHLTVLDLPTAYWHSWVSELAAHPQPLPPCLRLVVVGGEKASPDRLRDWQRAAGAHVAWLNTYGPTEAAIIAAFFDPQVSVPPPACLPVGRPIANTRIYLLDKDLQPVPVGVPGELFIAGAGLALGYLNHPELTAERFLPDPFSPGQRMYRSGDRARFLPDGQVEYLDRVDFQVKIRGFRVELGEIEAALSRHPAIRENVVWVREDNGLRRLVAYLVPADPASPPSASELRDFLHRSLPDYMLPAAFVCLQALPLTANGKVDRKALPAPEAARPDIEAPFAPPSSPAEHTLAEIWRQVLALPQVGVHDNFFELGGDFILSIQIVARANQAGLRLSPRQLFEAPTIAGLAALASSAPVPLAEQGPVTGSLPLTPIQRWFFAQDFPNPHHWNQSLLFALKTPLQAGPLREALQALLAHHDALRLRFTPSEEGWQAENAPVSDEEVLSWVDLAALPEEEQHPILEELCARLQGTLNITRGPLLRAGYFRMGAGRSDRLLLIVHHLAMDGVSWPILLEDLQAAYAQALGQQAIALPPKTTSFRAWAARLAQFAQSAEIRSERDVWLDPALPPPARLPLDFPGGDNSEASLDSLSLTLSLEETTALLHQANAAYHTETNDLLLAALARVLARWTASSSAWIEMEGHGREPFASDLDPSRTLGWFTTLYPVRLALPESGRPGETLKAVKEQLRAIPRQGLGYGLLAYSPDEARAQHCPLPQVSFNFFGQLGQALAENGALQIASEKRGAERDPRNRRSALIDVVGGISDGRLSLEWFYSRNLHRKETIQGLIASFQAELSALIAHCLDPQAGGFTPSDFPMARLDQKKLDKVLSKLDQTKERITK